MRGQDDGRARRRGQGELEALVLAVLRQAPGPVNAAWVQERLDHGLAYTTVITILTRLHTKGAAARERAGRSFVWSAISDVAGLAALRMRRVLDAEADREAVLARFVTALSPSDERVLRDLLERAVEPSEASGVTFGGEDRSDSPAEPEPYGGGRTSELADGSRSVVGGDRSLGADGRPVLGGDAGATACCGGG